MPKSHHSKTDLGDILIVDRHSLEMTGLGDTGRIHFDLEHLRALEDVGVICRDRHAKYSWHRAWHYPHGR